MNAPSAGTKTTGGSVAVPAREMSRHGYRRPCYEQLGHADSGAQARACELFGVPACRRGESSCRFPRNAVSFG